MKSQREKIVEQALALKAVVPCDRVLLFLPTPRDVHWYMNSGLPREDVVVVTPADIDMKDAEFRAAGIECIRSWSGNQTRFSRVKYAFLHGVLEGIISLDSTVVCVLGPWGKGHLDTITVHDLSLSWTEDFPLDPRSLATKKSFRTVMATIDIALDIGATGREGKPVGTIFVVGDSDQVMELSHQAVFNPFRGYPKRERLITLPEVVESVKELSILDGAIVISENGVVEAAGRHLDASTRVTKQLRGLGARHRAGAGITKKSEAVAVVVSESSGRITIFEQGKVVASLEPVIGQRLV